MLLYVIAVESPNNVFKKPDSIVFVFLIQHYHRLLYILGDEHSKLSGLFTLSTIMFLVKHIENNYLLL